MSNLVTPHEVAVARLDAMASVFETADSTLAGRRIKVNIATEYGGAPAWSKDGIITLNSAEIGAIYTSADMVGATGLNFHELAHELYTPQDYRARNLLGEGLFSTFNILEDQRIETLLIAEYRPLKPYFVMAVMRFIALNSDATSTAHGLTYGRKYLPGDLRDYFRQQWVKQDLLAELESIIDDYLTVVFPMDWDRAEDLIRRYHRLLQGIKDPHGHSDETTQNRRPAGQSSEQTREKVQAQQSAQSKVDDLDSEAQAEQAMGDGSDDDASSDGQDGDGSGDGKGEGKGEGNTDSTSTDEQGDGQQGSAGGPRQDPAKEVADIASRVIDKQMDSEQVTADLLRQKAAINSQLGKLPRLDRKGYKPATAAPDAITASRMFKRELQRLWVDSDPGWFTHRSSGRVNLRRAMRNPEDIDTAFDEWDEGKHDANEIELVILCDYSGSMRMQMPAVSEAMWIIKRSVESVKGEVTVMGYADHSVLMYDRYEKADPKTYRVFGQIGGTNPTQALDQARLIFSQSKKAHRMLVILTDGAWNRGVVDECDAQVARIGRDGVVTALAYMNSSSSGLNPHNCKVYMHIEQPMQFAQFAKHLVKEVMR